MKEIVFKRTKYFLIAFLVLLLSTPAHAGGNVNFFAGQKMLDKDDWEPLEDQQEFGVLVDFGGKDWPVHIAVDVLRSETDETFDLGTNQLKLTGKTQEINVGIRKIWDLNNEARPYVGVGVANIEGDLETEVFGVPVSVDDSAIGYWVNVGIFGTLAKHFNIGLDLRYSAADLTIEGVDIQAGGTHIGLLLGYHWD